MRTVVSAVAAVTVALAFALGLGLGRATVDKPDPIRDRALRAAATAKVFDHATQTVGEVVVTCKVYTNDPPAVNGTGLPKAEGWFVQACTADAVEE